MTPPKYGAKAPKNLIAEHPNVAILGSSEATSDRVDGPPRPADADAQAFLGRWA